MQSTQKLTRAFKLLVELLEQEASQNPDFALKLDTITSEIPTKTQKIRARLKRSDKSEPPPDIFSALQEKGEEEFRFWLRSFELPTLRLIIRSNGFDPAKITSRWTEPDKFVALITEQAVARLRRGSAFLNPKKQNKEGTS